MSAPEMQVTMTDAEIYLPNGATLTFTQEQIIQVTPEGILTIKGEGGSYTNYYGCAMRIALKPASIIRPNLRGNL